jgi:hypothetical protein
MFAPMERANDSDQEGFYHSILNVCQDPDWFAELVTVYKK